MATKSELLEEKARVEAEIAQVKEKITNLEMELVRVRRLRLTPEAYRSGLVQINEEIKRLDEKIDVEIHGLFELQGKIEELDVKILLLNTN